MAKREEFDDLLDTATERGARRRKGSPIATTVRYDRRTKRVIVTLNSGLELGFTPQTAEGLADASAAELSRIEITPSGLGLHFPRLDADLYLPSLLAGLFGSRGWIAARLGAAGGRARGKAKAAASRANGKLGGRPRKRAAG
jgi:hypothetical protein